ncbi:hypothetical protein CYMTET_3510 [Cymbomonas tetramitiformis]|uniref:Uncharacterized protein n=1 Tax=Cymbomonas tetramitiformis TaxID=36881 RepID=A0AAE0H3I0_9CHLO|nr:hypothetical protein CYMTET_3510 [Cymbomonas tetramitiformis]
MSSTILLDVKDRVATITFKRGKYNQFTEEETAQVAHDLMQNQPQRPIIRDNLVKKLQQVNAEESIALGQAVLEKPFLQANAKNATAKGDTATAWAFWGLLTMYPLISRL